MIEEKIKKFEEELPDKISICELVYQESNSKIKITKLGYVHLWLLLHGLRRDFVDPLDDLNDCPRTNPKEDFIVLWDHLDHNGFTRPRPFTDFSGLSRYTDLKILIKDIIWINFFDRSYVDYKNPYPLGEPVEIKHLYEGEGFGFEVVYLKNRNKVIEQFRENINEFKKIDFYKSFKERSKGKLISREIMDLTSLRIIKTISGPFYKLKGIEKEILSFSYSYVPKKDEV